MEFAASIYIVAFFLFGMLAGAAIVYLIQNRKMMALDRQNAELSVQLEEGHKALHRVSEEMDNRFKVSAQEALQKSNEQFLLLAQEKFKSAQGDAAHDMDKRHKAIDEMMKPVQEHLKSMSAALEQVKGTDQSLREQVHNLHRETAKLVGALRDPSAQGTWGEYILEGLLEKSGLIKGVHYETQVSFESVQGRQRPDAVIQMQDGFNIIIDAKAPINELSQRLSEEMSNDEFDQITARLATQVRDHVKKLGSKNYWENLDSPDFTVLFLPSEQLYSMALRSDPRIVEFAAANNIIIASPTLLMSLLRVVGMSWRQVELAKNAQEISELGFDLYRRFLKFTDHFEKIGGHLQKAMGGYDAAIGSMERQVLPAARKFKELQGAKAGMEELPDLKEIEAQPRKISMLPIDEQEKKRA